MKKIYNVDKRNILIIIKSIYLYKLLDKFKLHCQKIRHHFVTIYE